MNVPIISVLIPTYNRKDIVLEAIRSALKQEPNNFEIIVIDDGSTDGTAEYLQGLNLSIKIITQKNMGVAAARNRGIREARGEYIAFLDSDDLWLPHKLQQQLAFFTIHPETVIVFTDEYISEKNVIQSKTRFERNKPIVRPSLPAFVQHTSIHVSSIMAKKTLFDEVGLFNESLRIHEDSELWNRIAEYHAFNYIEQPLVVYRWQADPAHLMSNEKRGLFIEEGRKYLALYCEQRANRELTQGERDAIEESNYMLNVK